MNDMTLRTNNGSPGWDTKRGFWILTQSGQRVDLIGTSPEQIKLGDIAWHLTGVMRFTGAGARDISVAEHSLRVYGMVRDAGGSPVAQVHALMHDAHEAYMGDISTPVKRALQELAGFDVVKSIENSLDAAIASALKLPIATDHEHQLVKLADYWAMAFEKSALLPHHPEWNFDLSKSPFEDPYVVAVYEWRRGVDAGDFKARFANAMELVGTNARVLAALAAE